MESFFLALVEISELAAQWIETGIAIGLRGYVNKELNSLGLVSIPVGIPSLDRALIGVRVGELLSATWIESTTCKYL